MKKIEYLENGNYSMKNLNAKERQTLQEARQKMSKFVDISVADQYIKYYQPNKEIDIYYFYIPS